MQKQDIADKVKSLNILIEKCEKKVNINYDVINEKIEEISGHKLKP